MKRPYIVYTLSKDRTTQRFNKSKLQDIAKDIEIFLMTCTTAKFLEPNTLELTAYTAYDSTDPVEALNEIINKTSERFGASDKEPVAFQYPSGEPLSTNKYTWTFTKDRLQEVIQYIIDNSPMPKSNFGPLDIFISYNFKLLDITNQKELLNQLNTSSFLVWFSRGKSCSPTIFFPFEQADKPFWTYLDDITPYLPFKLEEKYLKIAFINKHGEMKSFKKIQRPISK
jgi:hypothetical protein